MRILYGVTGEGLGHAMRAALLIDHLLAGGHRVQIAASGRAATLLARERAELVSIAGLSIVYADGGVERLRTIGRNVRAVPTALRRNVAAAAEVARFDPEVVVTDFDSFAYAMGRMLHRPIISVDHQHVLSRYIHPDEIVRELSYDHLVVRGIVDRKLPRCARYIVTSFYFPSARGECAANTCLVGPIVRSAAARPSTERGEHVLVYQTGGGDARLLDMLAELRGFRFRVYGAAPRRAPPHLEYRPFSAEGFLADASSARAVITNGGYTTLSEAVCLGKPALSIPIRHQCEQELNAAYLRHAGLGLSLRRPTPTSLREAIDRLLDWSPGRPIRAANDDACRALDDALREVA